MRRFLIGSSLIAMLAPSAVLAQVATGPQPTSPAASAAQESATPSTQVADQTPAADAAPSDIVVTGSRITRNGYQAPTPVTVLGAEQLHQTGVTRLADFARTLPQFRNQGGAQSGSNSSSNGGQGKLDLRGLGANRNLVLLDRRRVVPSTGNGVVDVNILPSALVSRIDVVTGGASAAYGSDAVSGVINFVLDTKFTGVKGELSGGISSHGDAPEGDASLAFGKHFLDDRLRVIGSVEFYQNGPVRLLARDFLAAKPGIINNPTYTATNGQIQRYVVSQGIVTSYMTHGGLVDGCRSATGANIANCALKGTAFGVGGAPYQFQYGTYVNATGNMIAPAGSDYVNAYTSLYDGISAVNPSQRLSGFSHAEFDINSGITAYVEGLYTRSRIGTSYTVPPYRFGTSATTWFSVTADNPFLPASVAAQLSGPGGGTAAGPRYLNVGRINDDWYGNEPVRNVNTTYRAVGGLKGTFGKGWSWDLYYQYGRNTYFATIAKNLIVANANLAVDAVAAPAGNAAGIAAGTIVCRSTLTNPTNGCQPLNIFGVGAASQAAINYITGSQFTSQTYQQHVVEGSLQGSPFSTWAGEVSIAAGGSYRAERIDATSDSLSQASAFVIGNPQPYNGKYDVKEGFAEAIVPLIKDASFTKSLELNLAGRVTDYSTSGSVVTWKGGATWKPIPDVTFRVTRSRDIRAPSLQELYTGAVQARVSVIDPTISTSTTVNTSQYTGGNAALKPETANTFSGGIVLQPRFFPGFSLSVDYYHIKIDNVISTLSSQDIVNRCYAGNQALCAQIIRVGGSITAIQSTNINLNYLETSGLDIEASYRTPLSAIFGARMPGNVGIRVLTNYVDKFVTSDGVTAVDIAGSIASATSTGSGSSTPSQPHWTIQSTATYDNGGFQASVTNRYIGAGVIDNAYSVPNAIDDNHVASRFYTDLDIEYRLKLMGSDSQFFVNVNNVFNVKPPRGFGFGYGLNASPTYDIVGTLFKGGVRFKF
ncbi:TonB-dependent receptor plug domain-containing protein [Sphingomonas sp. UYP23]